MYSKATRDLVPFLFPLTAEELHFITLTQESIKITRHCSVKIIRWRDWWYTGCCFFSSFVSSEEMSKQQLLLLLCLLWDFKCSLTTLETVNKLLHADDKKQIVSNLIKGQANRDGFRAELQPASSVSHMKSIVYFLHTNENCVVKYREPPPLWQPDFYIWICRFKCGLQVLM